MLHVEAFVLPGKCKKAQGEEQVGEQSCHQEGLLQINLAFHFQLPEVQNTSVYMRKFKKEIYERYSLTTPAAQNVAVGMKDQGPILFGWK